MTEQAGFDAEKAHRFFAKHCFNAAWDFIRAPHRTPEDDAQMIQLSHASLWHWTRHPECTDKNLSIGYWQLSRVYALVGEAENARKYGELSLRKSSEPFYLGYAHEALARAEAVAGNDTRVSEHLAEARRHAAALENAEHRQWLMNDLDTVRPE